MKLFGLFYLTTMAQPDPQVWLFRTRGLNQRPIRNYGAYGDSSHNDRTYYKRDDESHPFNMDQYML